MVAEKVAEGVRDGGGDALLLKIEGLTDEFGPILDAVTASDAVIFGAPTYMGDVSAPFKAFADASSRVFATRAWADKLAAGFTNSHSYSGDKLHALQSLSILAAQHGMNWINLGLAPPGITAASAGRKPSTGWAAHRRDDPVRQRRAGRRAALRRSRDRAPARRTSGEGGDPLEPGRASARRAKRLLRRPNSAHSRPAV